MNPRTGKIIILFLAAGLVLVALAALNGCKKEPQPAPPPAPSAVGALQTQQTICPVMGNPIDKNVYIEHQGKKVYFCCPDCKPKFEADPEKYIAKLPQFKG